MGEKATQMGTTVVGTGRIDHQILQHSLELKIYFKVLMGESPKGDEFANITNEGLRHNLNVILETGQTLNYTDELEKLTQRFADIAGGTAQNSNDLRHLQHSE